MIPRHTSSPMKSASSSGPIGWLSPTRAPVSMSSAVPEPLLEGAHGLGEERHQDPVDDEARPVGRDDDLLAELGGEVADGRLGRVVGRGATDELDQRHDRHRAEEVHADEPARAAPRRPPRPAGRWRSRRCSRRRSRPAGRCRRARAHSARLDVEVLEHRLDDEVGVARPRRGRPSGRGGPASRRGPPARAGPSRPTARGCPRSGRGRPRRAPAPARTGRPACRWPRGPGRCRGPSARRRRRTRARSVMRQSVRRRRSAGDAGTPAGPSAGRRPAPRRPRPSRNAPPYPQAMAIPPNTAGATPNEASRNTLVVPTADAALRLGDARDRERRAAPGTGTRRPPRRRRSRRRARSGVGNATVSSRPTAATTSAPPDSLAAPTWSGSLANANRSPTTIRA